MTGANLCDDTFCDFNVFLTMRVGAVYHLYQKIRLSHLLKSRLKRLDKRRGKLMNKADRIG